LSRLDPVSDVHEQAIDLGPAEGWALLREAVVGRLGVVVHGAPEIFPVNYVVDHGSIVFRTAEGTKLAGALGEHVAFEVDGYDAVSGEAWSVVVKGIAEEIRDLDEVLDALSLPLHPWHAANKPRFVRVTPEVLTGRRFHVAENASVPRPDAGFDGVELSE